MPSFIFGKALNINSPQQNAACFIGSYNLGGWDANAKKCNGGGATFGSGNIVIRNTNFVVDNMEVVDGAMNDSDYKPQQSTNL